MTPIADAGVDTPEENYNKIHMSARNSVERTIGLLKGRFRCLLVHRVLHYDADFVAKIVIGCCVLHNMCNRAGIPAFELTDEEQEEEASFINRVQEQQQQTTETNADLAVGQSRRRDLVNSLWRARMSHV